MKRRNLVISKFGLAGLTVWSSQGCSDRSALCRAVALGASVILSAASAEAPSLQSAEAKTAAEQKFVLPDPSSSHPFCHQKGAGFELGRCINEIVAGRPDSGERLTIQIEPGSYLLRESIWFVDQVGITLRAERAGTVTVKVAPDYRIHDDKGRVLLDRLFVIGLVNSRDIVIENLGFDGGQQPHLKNIGACPEDGRVIQNVRVSHVVSSGFGSYFSIWGRAIAEEHFKTRTWSDSIPAQLMLARIRKRPSFVCGGSVRDVTLENSRLSLQEVGFYLVPYASYITNALPVSTDNWHEIAATVSAANTNIVIRGNEFVADPGLARYQDRDNSMGLRLTNAMKLHYGENVVIEGNLFDVAAFPRGFRRGAAVNLASGMNDVTIARNRFVFGGLRVNDRSAISTRAAFAEHRIFGIGTGRITVPNRDVRISQNEFVGGSVRLVDCCRPALGSYCKALDELADDSSLAGELRVRLTSDERKATQSPRQQRFSNSSVAVKSPERFACRGAGAVLTE